MAEWGKLTDDEKKVYTSNFKVLRSSVTCPVHVRPMLCDSPVQLCIKGVITCSIHLGRDSPLQLLVIKHAACTSTCTVRLPHDREVCVQEHAGADEAEALAAAEAEAKEAAQGAAPAATGERLFLQLRQSSSPCSHRLGRTHRAQKDPHE